MEVHKDTTVDHQGLTVEAGGVDVVGGVVVEEDVEEDDRRTGAAITKTRSRRGTRIAPETRKPTKRQHSLYKAWYHLELYNSWEPTFVSIFSNQ